MTKRLDGALDEEVTAVVASVLRVDADALTGTAKIADVAQIDSLTFAELASALDDRFAIRIPSHALVDVLTVADLIAIVERLVGSGGSSA